MVEDRETLLVETLDAALVAPGRMGLLSKNSPGSDLSAAPSEGVYVNLSNNVWGTNFRAWNGGDLRFRFRVRVTAVPRGLGRAEGPRASFQSGSDGTERGLLQGKPAGDL